MVDQVVEAVSEERAEEDGLIFGCVLDGRGGAAFVDWQGIKAWRAEQGVLWIHLDRTSERAHTWLKTESGLTPVTADAVLAEETRPRVFRGKRGLIAILRGVNMNVGAKPVDMVAIRMWCDGTRLITIRHRRLMTPRDVLRQLVDEGTGPQNATELFERLITVLTDRMAGAVNSFDDLLDGIETDMENLDANDVRRQLSDLRLNTVVLRRYLAPQREALFGLLHDAPDWIGDQSRLALRETTDRLQRYIEDLDAARERAIVLKDDIANRLAETMNRNMYILSIIAAIFLPLGFATGLLGINVGGMPGVDSAFAFWITCAIMVVILAIELIIFRKLKWL